LRSDKLGITPLHWASVSGYENIVHLLINNGAVVHVVNSVGDTPLHWASMAGHHQIAQILIRRGTVKYFSLCLFVY